MKTTTSSFFALCLLFCSGTVLAQSHGITYVKKSSQPNDPINIAGKSHTVVKIPVTELVSGAQFVVQFPASADFTGFTTGFVSAVHSSDPIASNAVIDSFPAAIQVIDGLNYILSSDGLGGYDFLVTGNVTVSVSVDIGDTIISISNTLQAESGIFPFLSNIHIPATPAPALANVVSAAEWNKYVDQTTLVAGLDKWIDVHSSLTAIVFPR